MQRKRRVRIALIAAAVVVFLLLYIEDWSRDFVATHAEISEDGPYADLRPLVSERSTAELVEAIQWAAVRIGSWEYIGDASEGNKTLMVFVRTSRILRMKDDITVVIEDRGGKRVVTATSQARMKIGDLGRNPRNLRRLLEELQAVLRGAARNPAPRRRYGT